MEYELSDYDKLRWPVHLIAENKNLADEIPELQKYPEFKLEVTEGLNFNKVIRYIVYCYDKYSPLFNDLDNVLKRKVTALNLAGFKADDEGFFDDVVNSMIQGKIININAMIIRYGRLQHSLEYSLLITGLDHFFSLLSTLQNRKEDDNLDILKTAKERNALYVECVKQMTELKGLAEQIFGEQDILGDIDYLSQDMDPTLIQGSFVEHYAKNRKQNADTE